MKKNIKVGVVMDNINNVILKKDTTISMIQAVQKKKYKTYYMEIDNIYLRKGDARACVRKIKIDINKKKWFELSNIKDISLSNLDVILMRKDPPFNMEFIYATYILEYAEKNGVLIINKPESLRNFNEKIFINCFEDIIPDSLITRNKKKIFNFLKQHKSIILKPLNKMGGSGIFKIGQNDSNQTAIIEYLTHNETKYCMAQKYIPEVVKGDKRIIIIDNKIIPYCLNRIAKKNENRSNLAVGGRGIVKKLNSNDFFIAKKVMKFVKNKGLIFIGLDVIGNYLTEINITSPTCVKEIESYLNTSITKYLIDYIEKNISKKN